MVEICCGSYEDAAAASQGGAQRIELNSALALGGLTPPSGCVRLVKENTDLKVISMVRPRGGGFCYTRMETEQMFEDAKILLEYGSDGLAFGFLKKNGEIDLEKTGRMIQLIHSYRREAVFHRAFDCTGEPEKAVSQLIGLGADRILTSGLKETAWEGRELLRKLQRKFGTQIELLAGSGVNAENARELMEYTGISQIHSSCRGWREDPTTSGENVSYSFAAKPHENDYDMVDESLVRRLTEQAGEIM
ncbi:MAG: copper homeostasis protein CutC [Clostridium sp.]|nr:copper homeostasis protein CutC [Clostridium sp.]